MGLVYLERLKISSFRNYAYSLSINWYGQNYYSQKTLPEFEEQIHLIKELYPHESTVLR